LQLVMKVMTKILRNRQVREEAPRRRTPLVSKHSEMFYYELGTKMDRPTGSRAQHCLDPTPILKKEAIISSETPLTLATSPKKSRISVLMHFCVIEYVLKI
jgi:hypothetical protein